MAQEQMRKAADLIKQGEKGQAGQILRGILRSDQKNAQAWWLLSLTQEDNDKAIRCLERALAIDPNHQNAKKSLAKRKGNQTFAEALPDYEPTAQKRKASEDEDYWNKLKAAPKKRASQRTWMERFGRSMMFRVVIFAIIAGGAAIYGLFLDSSVEDVNGNSPSDIALKYEEAYWVENYNVMVSLTCPGFESYTNEIWANTYTAQFDARPSDLSVDMGGIQVEELRRRPNEATIGFGGVVTWTAYGEAQRYDYDEEVAAQGGDVWIGHNLRRVDGAWMICDGPDVIYD